MSCTIERQLLENINNDYESQIEALGSRIQTVYNTDVRIELAEKILGIARRMLEIEEAIKTDKEDNE